MNDFAVRWRFALWILSIALALAACAPASAEPQPPEIAYGLDTCDACGMIIDEPRFASALLLENGETRKFDDIGDMFESVDAHPDQPARAWFVHDYDSEKWMRGETAFYVFSASIASPMGHGIAAFGEKASAETFAASMAGRVLNFDEARLEAHMKVHGE